MAGTNIHVHVGMDSVATNAKYVCFIEVIKINSYSNAKPFFIAYSHVRF